MKHTTQRSWLLRCILFGLLILTLSFVPILAGCNMFSDSDDSSETVDSTEPVTESKPVYTADTETFESFIDLKANVELYASKLPCTRSTLGYYSKGDGGAGTYMLTNERPDGVFERLADGVWASLVLNGEESINVKQFGAAGGGKGDDSIALNRATTFAKEKEVTLELPEGDYRTSLPTTFDNIKVISHNAKISFFGLQASTAAVYVGSNTDIRGTLNIWFVDNNPVSNHGERCGMCFGDYESGDGVYNSYVENVVITGGHENSNAVLITGDSNHIEIGKVYAPEADMFGRVVLLHWGNANDHYPLGSSWSVENGYGHAPNWKPTKHPHDIKIGTIEGVKVGRSVKDSKMKSEGALHIAAGYNVEVGELIVNGGNTAFTVTGGDIGFDYASQEEKANGMCNIKVGKINATKLESMGLYIVSYTLMNPSISVDVELTVDELLAEGSAKSTYGAVLYSTEKVDIKNATLRKFVSDALLIEKNNRTVDFGTLNVENCQNSAVAVVRYKTDAPKTQKVEIGSLNVKNSGLMTAPLIRVHQVEELHIGSVTTSTALCNYIIDFENSHDFNRVKIDKLDANSVVNIGSAKLNAIVHAQQAVSTNSTIAIGELKAPAGTPLTAGQSCSVKVGE